MWPEKLQWMSFSSVCTLELAKCKRLYFVNYWLLLQSMHLVHWIGQTNWLDAIGLCGANRGLICYGLSQICNLQRQYIHLNQPCHWWTKEMDNVISSVSQFWDFALYCHWWKLDMQRFLSSAFCYFHRISMKITPPWTSSMSDLKLWHRRTAILV